ncbi:hypothetical protein pb186bvf_014588 [Paramecium bursaria]
MKFHSILRKQNVYRVNLIGSYLIYGSQFLIPITMLRETFLFLLLIYMRL